MLCFRRPSFAPPLIFVASELITNLNRLQSPLMFTTVPKTTPPRAPNTKLCSASSAARPLRLRLVAPCWPARRAQPALLQSLRDLRHGLPPPLVLRPSLVLALRPVVGRRLRQPSLLRLRALSDLSTLNTRSELRRRPRVGRCLSLRSLRTLCRPLAGRCPRQLLDLSTPSDLACRPLAGRCSRQPALLDFSTLSELSDLRARSELGRRRTPSELARRPLEGRCPRQRARRARTRLQRT